MNGLIGRLVRARDLLIEANGAAGDLGRSVNGLGRTTVDVPVRLVGPDGQPLGAGRDGDLFHPTLGASGVGAAPPAAAPGTFGGTAPPFAGAKVGTSGPSGKATESGNTSGTGGKSRGVQKKQSVREAIAAIISSLGISAPPIDAWDPTGTSDGARGGAVLNYVIANGAASPREYLVWAAGWLAYSAPDATASSKSTPGDRSRDAGRYGSLEAYLRAKHPDWASWWTHSFSAEAPPGFSTGGGGGGFGGGGGGGGGGGSWADSAFSNFGGGGSWEGSSAFDTLTGVTGSGFDTLTAATGKMQDSIQAGNEAVVGAINGLREDLKKPMTGLGLRAGGVL